MHRIQGRGDAVPLHIGKQKSISVGIQRLDGVIVPTHNVIGHSLFRLLRCHLFLFGLNGG